MHKLPAEHGGRRFAAVSPWLILIIPPLCWAGNFVIGRAMHADIPPVAFTFWRWMVAATVLAPFAVRDMWSHRTLIRHHWLLLTLLALTGVVAFQFFVYKGLHTTTAINGVLLMSTIPVAIPIFAFAIDRSRISPRQILGIAISLAGVAIIVLKGDPALAAGLQFTPGDLWVSLSVPAWALYSVMVKRKPPTLPPLTLVFVTVAIGVVILAPGYVLELHYQGGFAPTLPALAALFYVGVFASVIAFACWNRGVALVGPSRAGLFIHLMPVFTAFFAMLFLGERLHVYHAAGIAAIAAGIWLSSTIRRAATSDRA